MFRRARLGTAVATSALTGVVLWLALVPHDHPQSADPRVPAYWWIMIVAAAVLGVTFSGADRGPAIGFALIVPQLLLAPFTAPRGDNDGLWLMWFPILVVFGCILMLVAMLAGWLRQLPGMLRRDDSREANP